MNTMLIVWGVAIVVFAIIEAIGPGLASIWFALGALVAFFTALLHFPIWLQIFFFIVVSGLTLWLTRPLARKYLNSRTVATNADKLIGTEALVTERIDFLAGTGMVKADGKFWSARAASEEQTIEEGAVVRVEEIRGVRLIVAPEETLEEAPVF